MPRRTRIPSVDGPDAAGCLGPQDIISRKTCVAIAPSGAGARRPDSRRCCSSVLIPTAACHLLALLAFAGGAIPIFRPAHSRPMVSYIRTIQELKITDERCYLPATICQSLMRATAQAVPAISQSTSSWAIKNRARRCLSELAWDAACRRQSLKIARSASPGAINVPPRGKKCPHA